MSKLSVIIPSWKDPYLHNTIDDILEHAEGDIEVIPVLDGYWPEKQIKTDPRVRVLHLGKNRGMRGAINAGVRISTGDYIMRLDEHCMFAQGFDKVLTSECEDNWIITARRYFLDPKNWQRMDEEGFVDLEKLVIQNVGNGIEKFAGSNWRSRSEKLKDEPISESMAMQGSMWVMPRELWDEVIGEVQTIGYGPLYQDSHEVVFKVWQAGGKLMVTKNTWFAHKHRKFSRTHNYGTAEATPGWTYALGIWRRYYEEEIKPKWGV